MNGQMDEWVGEWMMDRWMSGWMGEGMDVVGDR